MNQTQYARHRGINQSRVADYIAKGLLTLDSFENDPVSGKSLINVDKADAELALTIDPAKSAGSMTKVTKTPTPLEKVERNLESKPAKPVGTSSTPSDVESTQVSPAGTNAKDGVAMTGPSTKDIKENLFKFQQSKTSTEELKARKLQLEIDEREGRLLDADEVRKLVTKIVGETKEQLMNIPSKISPEILAMENIVDIETRLRLEINQALTNLSRIKV